MSPASDTPRVQVSLFSVAPLLPLLQKRQIQLLEHGGGNYLLPASPVYDAISANAMMRKKFATILFTARKCQENSPGGRSGPLRARFWVCCGVKRGLRGQRGQAAVASAEIGGSQARRNLPLWLKCVTLWP